MPIVSKYNADIQMRADTNVPLISESEARQEGERIAEFGKNISSALYAFSKQEEAMEKTDKQIRLSSFTNFAKEESDNSDMYAYGNADPSGKNLASLYDEDYKKKIQKQIDNEPDNDLKAMYQIEADKIRVEKLSKIHVDSIKMFKDYAGKAFDEQLNKASARVAKNPTNYDREWTDYEKSISESILTPTQKIAALENGRKSLANSAIDSYILAEDFDGARESLLNKFGGSFNSDEQSKMLESIKVKELRAAEISFKDENNVLKRAKEQKGFAQERLFQSNLSLINGLRQRDATMNEKDIRAIEDDLQLQVTRGNLKPEQMGMLQQILRNEDIQDSPVVANEIYVALGDENDYSNLKTKVVRAVADKELSTQTGMDILKIINSRQVTESGKAPTSKNDPRIQNALELIQNSIPKPKFSFQQKDHVKLYNMKKAFWENMQNPGFGGNPDKAVRDVLGKFIGKSDRTVRALGLQASNSPNDVVNTSRALYKRNQIKKSMYLDILRAQKSRLNGMDDLKDRKDGVK